jgi:hypothetical protein
MGRTYRDDHAGLEVGQLGTRGPERGGLARQAAVDDDVGSLDEVEERLAVVFERVQHHAALVGVMHGERDAGAGQRRPVVAGRASARGFHLDDVCTQVGEQAGHRVGNSARQVEDAHRIEQPVGHLHTVPAWSIGPGKQPFCSQMLGRPG